MMALELPDTKWPGPTQPDPALAAGQITKGHTLIVELIRIS